MSDLPTTFVSETQLRATLDPSTHAVGVEPLSVANSIGVSNAVDFTFSDASPPTGNFFWQTESLSFVPDAPIDVFPPEGATMDVSVNGSLVGKYTSARLAGAPGSIYLDLAGDGMWVYAVDADGVDHTAELSPLDGTTGTVSWDNVVVVPPTLTSITPSTFPEDEWTDFVIEGTGFSPMMLVRVWKEGDPEGVWYDVPSVSDTRIEWYMSRNTPGLEQWDVSPYTMPANRRWSNALPITVTDAPEPVITSLTPASVSLPAGATTFDIVGTDLGRVNSVQVGGQWATGFVVASDTLVTGVPFTPTAVGNVPVFVQQDNAIKSNTVQLAVTAPATPPPTLTSVTPNSGPPASEQMLNLIGTNFVLGCSVKIGGIFGSTVFRSATVLDVAMTTRPSPGAYDVIVTNPDGNVSNAVPFTVVAPPPATLTALSPASGPALTPTVVTCTGTGFVANSEARVGGTPVGGTFVSATEMTFTMNAPVGTHNVQVTNPLADPSNALPYTAV